MAEMIRVKNQPEQRELHRRQEKRALRRKAFLGKKFKDLSAQDKDQLLKAVAIRLGLLDED